MATKAKVARLESEIEKCRTESNWSKATDLARQVSTKSSPALGMITFPIDIKSNVL